jgi:hypothetical protein
MNFPETYSALGHYCGRFATGFWGEPANSLSNLAFLLGAGLALAIWRANPRRTLPVLILILAACAIGMGSFVFHSLPSPATLWGDLIPIQVFGLLFMGYVLRFRLRFSWLATVAALIGFFLTRQIWILLCPPGLLGGGASHLPTLIMLAIFAWALRRKADPLWPYLAAAIGSYVLALTARAFDIPLCSILPVGLHWVWHLLTALTASLIIAGAAKYPHEK